MIYSQLNIPYRNLLEINYILLLENRNDLFSTQHTVQEPVCQESPPYSALQIITALLGSDAGVRMMLPAH